MSERVHPAEFPASPGKPPAGPPEQEQEALTYNTNPPSRTKAPPGTYVIQVPKDQVYRVPSPENARRFQAYSRRAIRRRRRSCPCCLAWSACALLLLILALAATAGILYLIFRPELPRYSVDRLAAAGLNLTAVQSLSPAFDATVRAENPNQKIGIYYRNGSSVSVSYSDVNLCNGVWPAFYQGTRNVTVFETALRGSGVRFSAAMQRALEEDQSRGAVPLVLDVKVPVRIKFGAVTSWTITIKVHCEIAVDKLTSDSRIISKSCKTKLDF